MSRIICTWLYMRTSVLPALVLPFWFLVCMCWTCPCKTTPNVVCKEPHLLYFESVLEYIRALAFYSLFTMGWMVVKKSDLSLATTLFLPLNIRASLWLWHYPSLKLQHVLWPPCILAYWGFVEYHCKNCDSTQKVHTAWFWEINLIFNAHVLDQRKMHHS